MQQDILIIGVLFPAIPLMIVNFGNRYTVLANLIRNLHDEVLGGNISPQDAKRFLVQICGLRDRLRLIGIIQSCAAMAFLLALIAMITTYFDARGISSMVFVGSISSLVVFMLMFTREIQIANTALDVHLSNLEQQHEWQQYLKPKSRVRKKTR